MKAGGDSMNLIHIRINLDIVYILGIFNGYIYSIYVIICVYIYGYIMG